MFYIIKAVAKMDMTEINVHPIVIAELVDVVVELLSSMGAAVVASAYLFNA